MHQLAAKADIAIYFMVIPDSAQLTPGACRGLPADMEKPQKELATFFESNGLEISSQRAAGAASEKAAGRALYFPHDGHWNALGNELAAEQLSEFLSKEWLSE